MLTQGIFQTRQALRLPYLLHLHACVRKPFRRCGCGAGLVEHLQHTCTCFFKQSTWICEVDINKKAVVSKGLRLCTATQTVRKKKNTTVSKSAVLWSSTLQHIQDPINVLPVQVLRHNCIGYRTTDILHTMHRYPHVCG